MPSALRHRAYSCWRRVTSAIKKSKLCLHLYFRRNADEMRPVAKALLSPTRRRVHGDSPPFQAGSPPAPRGVVLRRPFHGLLGTARSLHGPARSPGSGLLRTVQSPADCTQASRSLSRAPRVRTGRIGKVLGLKGHCKENTRA